MKFLSTCWAIILCFSWHTNIQSMFFTKRFAQKFYSEICYIKSPTPKNAQEVIANLQRSLLDTYIKILLHDRSYFKFRCDSIDSAYPYASAMIKNSANDTSQKALMAQNCIQHAQPNNHAQRTLLWETFAEQLEESMWQRIRKIHGKKNAEIFSLAFRHETLNATDRALYDLKTFSDEKNSKN